MTPVTMFRCDGCGFIHAVEADAISCEATGLIDLPDPAEVGDIVLCGAQGWWSGDPEWRSEGTEGVFHGVPLILGKFVVVAKERGRKGASDTRERHKVWTILWTESTRGGECGNFMTSPDHIGVRVIGKCDPEKLAEYQAKSAAERKKYTPRRA
jgi:hypothetical protein